MVKVYPWIKYLAQEAFYGTTSEDVKALPSTAILSIIKTARKELRVETYKPKAVPMRRLTFLGRVIFVTILLFMVLAFWGTSRNLSTTTSFALGAVGFMLGSLMLLGIWAQYFKCPYCGRSIIRVLKKSAIIRCKNCGYHSQVNSKDKMVLPLDSLPLPTPKRIIPPRVISGFKVKEDIKIEIQETRGVIKL